MLLGYINIVLRRFNKKKTKNKQTPGGVRSCSVVLSINSLSTTRAGNFSSNDNLQISQSVNDFPSSSFQLHTLSHLFLYKRKNYLPRGRGTCPYEQRSEDLSQRVGVQAIAGLHLGDLGQVCEEVLQGETVMERDGGGALEDQAYLSVMTISYCTIWKSDSNRHEEDLYIKLL